MIVRTGRLPDWLGSVVIVEKIMQSKNPPNQGSDKKSCNPKNPLNQDSNKKMNKL